MKNTPTEQEIKELEDYAKWLKLQVLMNYPERDIDQKSNINLK